MQRGCAKLEEAELAKQYSRDRGFELQRLSAIPRYACMLFSLFGLLVIDMMLRHIVVTYRKA